MKASRNGVFDIGTRWGRLQSGMLGVLVREIICCRAHLRLEEIARSSANGCAFFGSAELFGPSSTVESFLNHLCDVTEYLFCENLFNHR